MMKGLRLLSLNAASRYYIKEFLDALRNCILAATLLWEIPIPTKWYNAKVVGWLLLLAFLVYLHVRHTVKFKPRRKP